MAILNGFKGEKFQFNGKINKFYNLISDFFVHINAKFNTDSNLDLIGIQVGEGQRINYIEWNATSDKIKLNNATLRSKTYFSIGEYDCIGTAETTSSFKSKEFVNSLLIHIGKYSFTITRNYKLSNFFEFTANILNHNLCPHGIIGQTASNKGLRLSSGEQGQGIIEGKIDDYEVSGLWSTNFKFNKFMKDKSHAIL